MNKAKNHLLSQLIVHKTIMEYDVLNASPGSVIIHADSQKIGEPNHLKVFEGNQTKGNKQRLPNFCYDFPCLREMISTRLNSLYTKLSWNMTF
jgi:hypothetical protein